MHPEAGGAEGAAAAAAPHAAPGAVLQREVPEEGAHQAGETSRGNQQEKPGETGHTHRNQRRHTNTQQSGLHFFPLFCFYLN